MIQDSLQRENRKIALAALVAISSLVGVSVMMFLDTHASRWEQLESLEEIEALRSEMAQTEARIMTLTKRAEQLEATNREMTATFLTNMGIGPLGEDTEDAVASTLLELGPRTPTTEQAKTLGTYMDSLGGYMDDVYQSMLKRSEYAKAIPTLTPTAGWITSHFGDRNSPFTGAKSKHNGIDIAAPKGTAVYAAADGVVGFSGRFGGYGKYVLINHGFGIVTRYGHVSKYFVYPGQSVKRGQKIAQVGSTGRSTGSHLHFEVRIANRAVDPRPFMVDAGEKILGDVWDMGELAPRTPLPDFAPMGGDPEETENESILEESATTDQTPLPHSTEEASSTLADAAITAAALNKHSSAGDLETFTPVYTKRSPINMTLEAIKIFFPWIVVGLSLGLLGWVAWRVSYRLRNI